MFCQYVSIHAPAKGATKLLIEQLSGVVVSIHAPAKGATCYSETIRWNWFCFNPRPREGGDLG